jgi:excisionase family DNA binding protein
MSSRSGDRRRKPLVALMSGGRGGEVSTPGEGPGVEEEGCSRRRPTAGAPSSTRAPLSLVEAAEYLNVSERFVRRLVAERRIPYMKVGRLLRFRADDLDQFLERCRVEPATPHPLLRRTLR